MCPARPRDRITRPAGPTADQRRQVTDRGQAERCAVAPVDFERGQQFTSGDQGVRRRRKDVSNPTDNLSKVAMWTRRLTDDWQVRVQPYKRHREPIVRRDQGVEGGCVESGEEAPLPRDDA